MNGFLVDSTWMWQSGKALFMKKNFYIVIVFHCLFCLLNFLLKQKIYFGFSIIYTINSISLQLVKFLFLFDISHVFVKTSYFSAHAVFPTIAISPGLSQLRSFYLACPISGHLLTFFTFPS